MAATTESKKGRTRTVKATAEGKAARDAMKMSLTALQKHKPSDGRLAYSETITEVAKRTKELSGSSLAPGAKQVLMVQKALAGKDPVEASGMTLAQLKRYVAGEMPREESRKLRQGGMAELEKKVADPFTKSRHMGGVLLGFHEQQQQDKRATRRADKAEQAEKAAEGAEAQAETAAA
jgi:hypothetical protein